MFGNVLGGVNVFWFLGFGLSRVVLDACLGENVASKFPNALEYFGDGGRGGLVDLGL